MARAFIQLVAFAACIILSLTAEDRRARSGDLDRGPNPEDEFSKDEIAESKLSSETSSNIDKVLPAFRNADKDIFDENLSANENSSEISFDNNGPLLRVVSNYFDNNKNAKLPLEETFAISNTTSSTQEAMALRRRIIEMSTEYFLVPPSSTSQVVTSSGSHHHHVHITKTSSVNENSEKFAGIFRNEVWVVPVLALSAITMLLIAGFEIFVLCKAWRTTPSRRHLFLGQMLLLGLFSCAGLAAVFAASPTEFTCALMRFGTGVAYAIVFASLLVKCVFLISLNSGVYLPAPYQGLLLLFAILIQIAIGVQWLVTNPPNVVSVTVDRVIHPTRNKLLVTVADVSATQVIPLCSTRYIDILLSLVYVIFLIIFVTVLAVKSRGIRDNYREATYIGLSVGCSIPTWLIWTISGFVVTERHRDACIAFGIVITSILVFLIMFMPKGRQLAAMGKEGVYLEDREDRFSSLSRAGSGYSPSFFHFKPIKYGMTSHGNKHQPITTLRTGDLALCAAAPPSYTRLFQYPPGYYSTRYLPGGLYLRPDDGNLYTTLEPTLSSNPNVYFQRGNGLHPGMMY